MAVTLTTSWQKVAEASTKVTQNITGYLRLYMKYGNRDVANNRDTIYYEIRQAATNPYGTYLAWEWTGSYNWSIRSWANVISPNPITGTMTQTPAVYSDGVELVRVSGSYVQEHAYDGTWTDTVTLSGPIYKTTVSGDGSFNLPQIIRNPSLSVSCSGNYGVSGATIAWTLGDTGGVSTKIQSSLNNSTWSDWQGSTTSTSGSKVITTNLSNYSTSSSITFYFRAVNNNGTSSTKSLTINIDPAIKPSMNSNYPYLTADNGSISAFANTFVKSITKVKVTVKGTAYANGGATIKQYNLTSLGGFNSNVAKNAIVGAQASGEWTYSNPLEKTGTIKAKAVVIDSRNRSSVEAISDSYTVYDYTAPTISNMQVRRCDSNGNVDAEGTYCLLSFDYAISSVNNKNAKVVSYKVNNGSWNNFSSAGYSGSISHKITGTYAVNTSATIYVRLQDSVYTGDQIVFSKVLGAGYMLRSLYHGGKGITLGQVATEEGFNVYLLSKFMNKVKLRSGSSYGLWNEDGSKIILADWGNTNVIYNALGGTLFLGYQNTTALNFLNSKASMDSSGNITAPRIQNANGGSWYKGRDYAVARCTKSNDDSWHPVISSKTKNGSWELGNLGNGNVLKAVYITDANYNSNTNNVTHTIDFPTKNGTLATTGDIPTNTNQLTNGAGFINTSNSSKGSDGYFKLSNGLIVQWGSATCGTQKTMPTSFSSTSSFSLIACEQQQGASATINVVINAVNKFTPYAKYGSTYYTDTVRWIAIGY